MMDLYLAFTRYMGTAMLANEFIRHPYVLFSAGNFFGGRSWQRLEVPEYCTHVIIDSGAQQFLTRFKTRYPYSTTYYLTFVKRIRKRFPGKLFAVSLDYPLDLLVPRGMSKEKAIQETAENTKTFLEKVKYYEVDCTPLPVIQGLELEDFKICMEIYETLDLLNQSRFWGIGSLCMENSVRKIYEVCRYVRKKLGRAYIHVFGPRTDSWPKICNLVDSVDTGVFGVGVRHGRTVTYRNGKFKPLYLHGKGYSSVELVKQYIEALLQFNRDLDKQCTLETFMEIKG